MIFLLTILLILLLSTHMVCMLFASTVPFFCIWLARREAKHSDVLASEVGQWMAGAAFLLFHAGVVLGIVMAWVMHQYGETNFLDAIKAMPRSRIWYGYWEMAFYAFVMGGYAGWWMIGGLDRIWQRVLHALLAVAAATNLLYHFPPLFAILSQKAGSSQANVRIDNPEFLQMMFTERVIYSTLHFWLASTIVSAVFIIRWIGGRLSDDATGNAKLIVKISARVALIATALQLIVGVAVLFHLPKTTITNLMGGNIGATFMLVVGSFATFALIHVLSTLAMGQATLKLTRRAMMFVLLIVLSMSAAHLLARGNDYRPDFPAQSDRIPSEAPLLVESQLG